MVTSDQRDNDSFESAWHGIGTGGSPALDLANTLDWRLRAEPIELFRRPDDLLRWGRSAGLLTPAEARRLRTSASPRPAKHALSVIMDLRETCAALFQALVDGTALAKSQLAALEREHRRAVAARSLTRGSTPDRPRDAADRPATRWVWREGTSGYDRIRHAVALDAVRILTTTDAHRVRQCADAECGWFFLDTSRNHSRRWCSMKGCGNRNKVRRFYRRTSGTRSDSPAMDDPAPTGESRSGSGE
ncbi:MAG: CGNR zinc finger domain-containing protein [Candidatus Eisenbacteria bacterium]|uniref:CGNR zinc finger domain-containing protein n=1 Tax=Eiseniibacteriota bacterium TaxID=2212470 RepID=A0A956RMJ2_UNCEI|nr:CGNR zinc finger domain-containing protein [Candidatus Eisenbacteria bacterium]